MQFFICYTPLQILVAKKIIHSEKIQNYCFVFFYDNESEKNIYYYKLLENEAFFSKKILRTKTTLSDFTNIYKLSQKIKDTCKTEEVNIYSGNIKSVHTRFLMFLLKYTNLYTFDDGCGNISNTGYYADNNEKIIYKLFFQLFDPSLVYKSLRKKIKVHYTIFKEKNIYPNCKYMPLYENLIEDKNIIKEKKTILLTSVLSEDHITNEVTEIELYRTIISNFNVTDVIPHPREKKPKINEQDVNIIHSSFISEDLLFQLSQNYELTIIGIFSATLLNLAGLNIIHKLISIDFENSHINKELIETFKSQHIECYKYYSNTNQDSIIKL